MMSLQASKNEGSKPEMASSEGPSLIGKVLSDRYQIERLLDEGGMGKVYLAQHLLMHKRFAIKVLHASRSPEAVVRFEREAMAASHIDHPNVAAATDFGKCDDGCFFLVLEYVEGQLLSSRIAEGPIEVGRALHIAHQMTSALASAHALGIVHRDVKPDNVMLVERDGDPNFVKVLDFGIAKVPAFESKDPKGHPSSFERLTTQTGMIFGTPEYMSPEQALGNQADARSDLYGLGLVMFEMLTGSRPFDRHSHEAGSASRLLHDPPAMASVNANVPVPEPVEALVRRLLARDPGDRFQTADEVLDAIETCGSWTPRTRKTQRPAALPFMARARFELLKKLPLKKLPTDLLAGVGAGLVFFFLITAFFRSHGSEAAPEKSPPPSSCVTVLADGPPMARLDPPPPANTGVPIVEPRTIASLELDKGAPAADKARAPATSKSKVRQKRPVGLTDFGGRR
jgi:serine/threonine protein kinase